MIFKSDTRSFKFCLLGLNETEYKEISTLITQNGGELCDTSSPPVITFSSCNQPLDNTPVFNVNYISECLRQGKLLDLAPFQFGHQGFFGCLMSIFTRGNNLCPSINDIGPCCASTAIGQEHEDPSTVNPENNYAMGDCSTEQVANISSDFPPAALNSTSQNQQSLPNEFPQDSELLPESLPRAAEVPDSSPRDSQFLPDSLLQDPSTTPPHSPQDSQFLPDESSEDQSTSASLPLDRESLPQGRLQDSELLLQSLPRLQVKVERIDSPQDSEFPPDSLLQNPSILPAGAPLDQESLPEGGSQDSVSLLVESPPGLIAKVETIDSPRDSEFLPDIVLQDASTLPIGSPGDSQFLPDIPLQDPSSLPIGSPGDSQFLPDIPSQDQSTLPTGSPGDSQFLPDIPSQDPSTLPTGSPGDSQFLPDIPSQDQSTLPAGFSSNRNPMLEAWLQNSERLLARSLPGLELEGKTNNSPVELPSTIDVEKNLDSLLGESVSSLGIVVPETPEPSLGETRDYSDTSVPELVSCEEFEFPKDGSRKEINVEQSSTASAGTSKIPRKCANTYSPIRLSEERKNSSRRRRRSCSQETVKIIKRNQGRTSPRVNGEEISSLNDVGEETELDEHSGKSSAEQETEVLLEERLQRRETSQPVTPERGSSSPVFGLKRMARKTPTHNGKQKAPVGPTNLREESNGIKNRGKSTSEVLRDVENFQLLSTDSDVTDYVPSPAAMPQEKKRLENLSLSARIRNFDSKGQSKRNSKVPGPSRESNASEDESIDIQRTQVEQATTSRQERVEKVSPRLRRLENRRKLFTKNREMAGPSKEVTRSSGDTEDTDVSSDSEKSERRIRRRKAVRRNDRVSSTGPSVSRTSKDERNTVVSSTGSSDTLVILTSHGSGSSSEEVVLHSPRKAASNQNSPNKTSAQNQTGNAATKKSKRPKQISRNFLPWEQREMINYLINNRFISDAKGNRVWKQMIHDGYLSHRTYQSLNNHFRKFILPNISKFPMKSEFLRRFERIQQ